MTFTNGSAASATLLPFPFAAPRTHGQGSEGWGLARSPGVSRAEQPQWPQNHRFWMQAHGPGIPTGREQPCTQQTEPGLRRHGTYPVPDLSPAPHPTQEEEQ